MLIRIKEGECIMSAKRNPKYTIAKYEMLSEWDEVLLGDQELFDDMVKPHISMLMENACREIRYERLMGNLDPYLLQPEELLNETLIQAWHKRHARTLSKPFRDWLLEVQKLTLNKMVDEEKRLHDPIVFSLESPLPRQIENNDENEFWEWIEPPPREYWADVIPDSRYLLSA
jgi:DNA-directed RNA polymerase specialized sigma24 family protein